MSVMILDMIAEYTDRTTGNRQIRAQLIADTVTDLPSNTTALTYLLGSYARVIDTGKEYYIDSSGTWIEQPSPSAFSNVYTKAEIDAMLTDYYTKIIADDLFVWKTITITAIPPISFNSDGNPLILWSMKGNGQQTGTPTPDNPVMPEFVGTLDDSDWTVPITCAGQTVPVYLGQTQTVRKIRKLVLTGEESWSRHTDTGTLVLAVSGSDAAYLISGEITCICTHYPAQNNTSSYSQMADKKICMRANSSNIWIRDTDYSTTDFKTYLQQQYENGTPVTVWYVLATEQTAIVNEPLAKIGDYADELSSEDAAVTIPTAMGQNTLTVDTTLQPSEVSITGHIRET